MESHSLLPSDNIKLEPACEADNVHSSTREMIFEVQGFEKLDSKIPESVKIEQPEVYVNYPGGEIHPYSQSCPSQQEQSQMKKKMMLGQVDWKFVKHKPTDILCKDKGHRLSKRVSMASCYSIQEVAGHSNTEPRMPEDTTTLIPHHEVSLTGTQIGYAASQQDGHCSHISESVSSMIEINTKLSLTDEHNLVCNVETPNSHYQVPEKSLDYTVGYTSCGPQRIQAENTSHVSDVCDVTFSEATVLHRHNIRDTGQKPYKCDVCGASFNQTGHLTYHMRTHTGEKPYKCDICAISFTQSHNLKCHMRTHTGEKPYKCDVCAISFTQSHNLKCHMRTHTGEKPYKCDICSVSFAKVDNLKCHVRTHTGEKPYNCNICSVLFANIGSLKRHMRTHTGEKPYICDVCAASFTQAGNLKCHMRTHTGEKPYKCDICSVSFAKVDNLKCHVRTHTGEKPYKCEICAASFTETGSLKCHLRTHKEEKLHRCDICAVSFTEHGILKRHMRTHTGQKLQKLAV